jgi:hypothetical protein
MMSKQQKLQKVANTVSGLDSKLTKFQAAEIAEYILVKSEWDCKNAMVNASNPYKINGMLVWG